MVSFRLKLNNRVIILDKPATKELPNSIIANAEPTNTNMVPKSFERAIWPFFLASESFFAVGSSVFSPLSDSAIRVLPHNQSDNN